MDDGIAAEAFDGMFDGIFYEMFQAHQLVEVQSIRSASVYRLLYPIGDYYDHYYEVPDQCRWQESHGD